MLKDVVGISAVVLVGRQIHLIQPNVIRFLFKVSVHLKSNIDFFQGPIRLVGVIGVDVVGLIANAEADVVHLVSDALQVPDKMDPGVGGKRRAVELRRLPASDIIPDVPLSRSVEVALRAPHPAISAERLIQVKFERL